MFRYSGYIFTLIFVWTLQKADGQNVSLYKQFSGQYDFTFVGNTLNPSENTNSSPTFIYTESSATLNLTANDEIFAAYLYWAGCGPGDFDIRLNGIELSAQRKFSTIQPNSNFPFFGGFYDVTNIVSAQGNGVYTLSELDVNDQISTYRTNATHFAGWAIFVVYKNNTLPLNVINVYDGFESLSQPPQGGIGELVITLENLNVIDNAGSKIGFIAWEGDRNIAVNESLKINDFTLEAPPLNPWNNAFNGTNSITGSNQLYNMDLDIYNIQNYIQIGDEEAKIALTTGQDYVIINTIITKLNSQLPDATIEIGIAQDCDSNIRVDYTVFNINSTEILPANTKIGFYIDDQLLAVAQTQNDLPIDGSEQGSIILPIPQGTPQSFTLSIVVDYDNAVTELREDNNKVGLPVTQYPNPDTFNFSDLTSCNLGLKTGAFDLSTIKEQLTDPDIKIAFFETQNDAENNINPITEIENYRTQTPKQIWVRFTNNFGCFSITSLNLYVKNCKPKVYNAVSVNGDGQNDVFFIDGLRDIFMDFKLEIYNRWGRLLWTGDNDKPDWDGYVEKGVAGEKAPDGTYYYILYLNDTDYPDPISGYLYLTH